MRRTTCHFSGTVQGVGFRYTVMNIAKEYNVTGFVRNLADGRVELVVEGPDDQTEGLLEDVSQQMGDYIRDTKKTQSVATGEFERFTVRH